MLPALGQYWLTVPMSQGKRMIQVGPDILDAAQGLWSRIALFFEIMVLPMRLYQAAAILALALMSLILGRIGARMLNGWLRSRANWPKWRLRLGILIGRRLGLMIFVLLAWGVVIAMRAVTWPSHSALVALAASIATAWLAIFFLMRLVANRLLRRILSWSAWVWVTLFLLDLTEPVGKFLDSIALTIGDFRLSVLTVMKVLLVTGLMITGARMLSRLVSGRLARNQDLSPTMRVLTTKLLQIVLFSLAIIVGLRAVGFDLTGLAVFSGAVGVGLGFGLQKVVSNLVSGVIILLDKSVKPGDVISLGDTFGWIEELGARYVNVVTRDGKAYLIPNEDLVTGQVVNWSHNNSFVRLDLKFRASYHDDPHKVTATAIAAVKTVKRVLTHRQAVCWVTGFGDSSIDYVLRFWIDDAADGLTNVRGQVYLALWDAFQEQGITIPFPQREVRLVNAAPPIHTGDPRPDDAESDREH